MLLGLLMSRRITRPVEALTEGARRVAEGARDVQVTVEASGEVGELVRAFNHMTSELRATTERLVASERIAAWQEVARRLAHEIKNPLTPIQMSLETLLAAQSAQDARFPTLFRDSAAVVLEEVDRLRRIVDEFSRFARLPKPQLAPVDLGELAQSVLALYATPPEGITLLPTLQTGVVAQADRDQLTQVLVNLVKNAEEAMADKGGAVRVRVKGTEDGRHRRGGGQRPGHCPRAPGPHLRALLHHQGGRHRAGPGDCLAHPPGARRQAGGGRRARRGRALQRGAAARALTQSFTGVALRAALFSLTYTWNFTVRQVYFAISCSLFLRSFCTNLS